MTAQVPAEGPFYSADGSFLGYVGQTATLVVQMVSTQEEGPPLPQDLSGRLFQQRIESTDGDVLLTIVGVNGWQGVAHAVAFPLLTVDTQQLLPSHAVARDMVHVVGEVTGDGFEPIFSAPFALRRLRRSGGATVLQVEPNVGIVLVRYAGAPPLSLLQSLINAGDLAEDATHDDLVAWLQSPANDAGETMLEQIAAAGAAKLQDIDEAGAIVTGVGGTIDVREDQALAAIATREGQAVNVGGAIDTREDAALAAIAVREGQAINAGGAIDLREDQALAAIATREGQAVDAGGAIDVREDAALAAIAVREGQAINAGGAIDLREDQALAAVATREGQAVDAGGAIDVREDAALAAIAVREGQAINAGGAIDLREDTAIAAVAAQQTTSSAAVVAVGDAQALRLLTTPLGTTYTSKANGDAAGLATGSRFVVAFAPGSGFGLYVVTGAGTSTLVNTYADLATVNAAVLALDELDELRTIDAIYNEMCHQYDGLPEAAIFLTCVSQSRGSKRLSTVSGVGPVNSYMLYGGAYSVGQAYNASNALWQGLQSEFATRVQFQETGGEGTLGGTMWGLSGWFDEVSAYSAAVGARTIDVLANSSGPYANESAGVDNLCLLAIAAGKKPCTFVNTAQSEADATAGTDLTAWGVLTVRAWEIRQWRAAVATGRPDWIPIVLASQQMQMSNTNDKDQLILEAQREAVRKVRRAVLIPTNHITHTSDRVHPDSDGMFEIGQLQANTVISMHFFGRTPRFPRVVSARYSGTTVTIVWDQDMTADGAFDYGSLLDANFKNGFGWKDNGTWRAVTAATTAGRISTLTLGAAITGTEAQQVLYVGCQPTTATLTSGTAYRSGHIQRATDQAAANDNFNSQRQAFAHKRWALQQRFAQVKAA